jgi:hypothetical protein
VFAIRAWCKARRLFDRVEFSWKRERFESADDSRSASVTFAAFEYSEDVRADRVC